MNNADGPPPRSPPPSPRAGGTEPQSSRSERRSRGDDLFSEELLLIFPELFTAFRAVSRPMELIARSSVNAAGKQFIFSYVCFSAKAVRREHKAGRAPVVNYCDRSPSQNFPLNLLRIRLDSRRR
jgi:hypothetical protein